MSSAAQLGNLLNTQADLNYYTMQLTHWSDKYEANQKKLNKQMSYETKWESAFDDAQNVDKTCKTQDGRVWKEKDVVLDDAAADAYAHAKVKEYDEELSLELAELDVEYDTMKTMYEALVTELQAQKESEKQSTATSMQDTHLLQS